jgi:hypothetical protein
MQDIFKIKRVGFWCKEEYIKSQQFGGMLLDPVLLGILMYILTNTFNFTKILHSLFPEFICETAFKNVSW